MTPAQLSRTVLQTVRRAVEADELRVAVLPERVKVQTPPRAGRGDYATNVALQLARGLDGGGPAAALRVAEVLRRRLVGEPGIAGVEIAGPGFLNITVEAGGHAQLVRGVLERGEAYGRSDALARGPAVRLAPGRDVRAAVVGAAVVRLVAFCGGEALVVSGGFGTAGDEGPGARAAAGGVAPGVCVADGGEALRGDEGDVDGSPEALSVRPVNVSAPELLARLGLDAARWALLRPAAHDLPDLDPDRLLAQRESNPLFRVRYAHARVRALVRNGRQLGVHSSTDGPYRHPAEVALIATIADYPRLIESAARHRAPDRLARHLEAVADGFFRFHDACPPLPCGEEKPMAAHRSRLALAEAAGVVLAGGLHLLGISAPEHL
ncbi:ArgS-related anticodon-binding protein NrtL [Streptomyces sparsogenes]|uniref:ArgS-related anticodon-binding protein NrtL n=1 Tax=Streptomyces sparsogenes TaxID=67365 RepID=UPI0008252A2A|nr:DALR anticodon-binding domain-containing protein [Streptomyces sparsogenes]